MFRWIGNTYWMAGHKCSYFSAAIQYYHLLNLQIEVWLRVSPRSAMEFGLRAIKKQGFNQWKYAKLSEAALICSHNSNIYYFSICFHLCLVEIVNDVRRHSWSSKTSRDPFLSKYFNYILWTSPFKLLLYTKERNELTWVNEEGVDPHTPPCINCWHCLAKSYIYHCSFTVHG